MDVRRHVRNLLVRNDLDVPVLSFQEMAPEFSVQPLATIAGAPDKDALEVAAAGPQSEPAETDAERRAPSTMAAKTAVEAR
jgi:type III secretion protein V